MILYVRPTENKACFLNCHPLFVPYRYENCKIQRKSSSFVCVNSLVQYLYKIFRVGISVRELHYTSQRPHIQPASASARKHILVD